MGTLHEDQYTFSVITRSILLSTKHVSDNNFNNFFIFRKSCLYKMWKNNVEADRAQMTIKRTRLACCIPKATNTH
jgi:hypothetical protein